MKMRRNRLLLLPSRRSRDEPMCHCSQKMSIIGNSNNVVNMLRFTNNFVFWFSAWAGSILTESCAVIISLTSHNIPRHFLFLLCLSSLSFPPNASLTVSNQIFAEVLIHPPSLKPIKIIDMYFMDLNLWTLIVTHPSHPLTYCFNSYVIILFISANVPAVFCAILSKLGQGHLRIWEKL